MVILDFGSGATCKNDVNIVKRMIDELVKVDTRKHEVVIKFQLFQDAPPNTPLRLDVFDYAYYYAEQQGYQTTASVFDLDSLKYLLCYDVPFVKIANRPELYWLAEEIPRRLDEYGNSSNIALPIISIRNQEDISGIIMVNRAMAVLFCVSEYPATIEQYEQAFPSMGKLIKLDRDTYGISDHTTDFTLYHKYKPNIYEIHYRLTDSIGPDAGPFARTPEALAEILGGG